LPGSLEGIGSGRYELILPDTYSSTLSQHQGLLKDIKLRFPEALPVGLSSPTFSGGRFYSDIVAAEPFLLRGGEVSSDLEMNLTTVVDSGGEATFDLLSACVGAHTTGNRNYHMTQRVTEG